MLIYQVNHIAIHYPESWDECRLFDFRIEPYSRYGQCLLVFDHAGISLLKLGETEKSNLYTKEYNGPVEYY